MYAGANANLPVTHTHHTPSPQKLLISYTYVCFPGISPFTSRLELHNLSSSGRQLSWHDDALLIGFPIGGDLGPSAGSLMHVTQRPKIRVGP